MGVILFDHEYRARESGVPVPEVKPLTNKSFIPRGNTAILDAIGKMIRTIEKRAHEGEEVMVVILTDGHENALVE
ncbi:MAG: hypothetical protein GX268_12210 [Methanomicrobiales archaeon]|jgi:uncharacterized protein YegL|nr:hypothetical protein [Methanomicrobiales archaeon]